MTIKTIEQLPDGQAVITNAAVVAFDQPDQTETQSTTIRPNPPNTHYVTSQAQLETVLGSNLEIPDGERVTIFIDDSFTLTKGFKIGTNSTLELARSRIDVEVNTIGITEPLFSNLNPVTEINSLIIEDGIRFIGDKTQPFCILKGLLRCFMLNCVPIEFDGAETEFPFYRFDGFPPVDWSKGWIIKNPEIVQITITNLRQLGPEGLTFFSFILNNTASIIISNNSESAIEAGDSLLYIDKNAPLDTNVKITGTSIKAGEFYQLGKSIAVISVVDEGGDAEFSTGSVNHHLKVGEKIKHSTFTNEKYNGNLTVTAVSVTDPFEYEVGIAFDGADTGTLLNRPVTVDSVADNGSGKTRFTTESAHNLKVGQVVRLGDFATYDQTTIVTAIAGLTFDADITFVATETGFVDAASADSLDIRIDAQDNLGQRDSMTIAEASLEIFGSEVSSVSLAQDEMDVISNALWRFKNLERFDAGTAFFGQVINKSKGIKVYRIDYSGTIEKSGGGSTNIGIILIKNSTDEIAFNPPHTVNAGKIQVSGSELIELDENDTLEVGVKNYDSSNAVILTSQVNLVVSKG